MRTWKDKDGDLWREVDSGRMVNIDDMQGSNPGGRYPRADVERIWGPLTLVQSGVIVQCDDRRWRESEEHWSNGVLLNAPDSWDGDDAAEHIALSYVATLEARMDAAGISREKWVEP